MDCAFFPYGLKTKEFLIKRSLYLIEYLSGYCDKIIIACNTLSLLIMPYVNKYYSNVFGVFESLEPYINEKSIIIGSKKTIEFIGYDYSNICIDGTKLIECIQNNIDYNDIIKDINYKALGYDNIILACTHFMKLNTNDFIIKAIKNN